MNDHISPHLPPEIWDRILHWATVPPGDYPAPHYQPFRLSNESPSIDESLRTGRAVVQVCRMWRSLATVYLYKDVRVRNDVESLKAVLAGNQNHTDNGSHLVTPMGRYVRRLELPYPQTVTESSGATHSVIEILESCPHLQTLVRPFFPTYSESARFEFPAQIISLPSLTRLEWWQHNGATRSGGINSLVDVLRNAPSLQFLTIGGEFWMNGGWHEEAPLRLPTLTTLRLRRTNALFVSLVTRWELPSLVHVIVDFPSDHMGLEALWSRFGSQLCTVEFGRNIAFHMCDQIAPFIQGCSGVKIFHYFVNFTAPPTQSLLDKPSSLRRIGIHAAPCELFQESWLNLESHLSFLCSHFLPHLEQVILHGNWQETIRDERFATLRDRLEQKGAAVVPADQLMGSPCEHL